jgi:hypothetical protein
MRRNLGIGVVFFAALLTVATGALCGLGQTKDRANAADDKQRASRTTPQVLMRDKLTYANQALEGLVVEDFDKLAKSADMMRIISRAASWYVIGSDEYKRYSKNFQEQAADLERHAKDKNLDAANLDYVRITLTCVECHKYLRETRSKQKP